MRIERVEGNRKIRVLLSQDDLLEMNINIRTLTPDSPELHSFLFRVMEYVRRETGFNVRDGQVVVEASPLGEGVVLTVTKIEQERRPRRINAYSVRAKKKIYSDKIYRFADFEALCAYFRLADTDMAGRMRLYSYEKKFFVAAATVDRRIYEFAERIPPIGNSERFLIEHGSLIAQGEALKNMAIGIKNLK